MSPKTKTQRAGAKKTKKDKVWKCDQCDFMHPAWHDDCSHCLRKKCDILNLQAQLIAKSKNGGKDGKNDASQAPVPAAVAPDKVTPKAKTAPGPATKSSTTKVATSPSSTQHAASPPPSAPATPTDAVVDDDSEEMLRLKKTETWCQAILSSTPHEFVEEREKFNLSFNNQLLKNELN